MISSIFEGVGKLSEDKIIEYYTPKKEEIKKEESKKEEIKED